MNRCKRIARWRYFYQEGFSAERSRELAGFPPRKRKEPPSEPPTPKPIDPFAAAAVERDLSPGRLISLYIAVALVVLALSFLLIGILATP